MKKVLIILTVIIVAGCTQVKNNNIKTEAENIEQPKQLTKLDAFISTFLDNNTEWTKNDIVLKETNDEFKSQFTELLKSNDSIFFSYQMELLQLLKNKGKINGFFKNGVIYLILKARIFMLI